VIYIGGADLMEPNARKIISLRQRRCRTRYKARFCESATLDILEPLDRKEVNRPHNWKRRMARIFIWFEP
jgi:hypothetical protein